MMTMMINISIYLNISATLRPHIHHFVPVLKIIYSLQ